MHKLLIIAEAGINHDGDMDVAQEMIRQAKKCGANIFKTQVYEVDKLFPDKTIMVRGENWYNEVKKTELTYEQVKMMADYCKEVGIEFMASAFDEERIGWLERVGVKRHKLASIVNHDSKLIMAMIKTDKPIIVSSSEEIQPNCSRVKTLYCIREYPTPLEKLEFSKISFGSQFDGFSDHTIGIEAACVAMARGATIIEKHFSLNSQSQANPDHVCSASPSELARLVEFARKVEVINAL